MISLLCPSRKRPDKLKRMYDSAVKLANDPESIELIFYTDKDDDSYKDLVIKDAIHITDERIPISKAWNKCWEQASGDILGLVADDIVFNTKNWDAKVKEIFNEYPDKIAYVFGDDGSFHGKVFGTHGFIHQNWAQAVGYFVPPYFSANQVDRWLNEVARELDRLRYGGISMEHMHWAYAKAGTDLDSTYEEGRERASWNESEWDRRQKELKEDIEKLRGVIDEK